MTDILELSEHPIFDAMFAEMDDDLACAAALVSEYRVWEFDYFDDAKAFWDELTSLSVPMPIAHAIRRLEALTTDTQLMTILAPTAQAEVD